MSILNNLICKIITCPPPTSSGDVPPPIAPTPPPPPPKLLRSSEMLQNYAQLVGQQDTELDSRQVAILSNLVHAQLLLEAQDSAALILTRQVQQITTKSARALLAETYWGQVTAYEQAGDATRAGLARQMASIYQQ